MDDCATLVIALRDDLCSPEATLLILDGMNPLSLRYPGTAYPLSDEKAPVCWNGC